jgi:hypothetical protein
MRDGGILIPTDFTSLIRDWQISFDAPGFVYDAESPARVGTEGTAAVPPTSFGTCSPSPFSSRTVLEYSVSRDTWVRLAVYDVLGREVALLVDEPKAPGRHAASWDASRAPSGSIPAACKAVALVVSGSHRVESLH